MNGMTEYQRRKCLQALDKLCEYSISRMFAAPVDPIADRCPNYFSVVTHPMDLGTIRTKLLGDEYNSVQSFTDDVNLVWENTRKYNGHNAIISLLARQLQQVFSEITGNITGDDARDWTAELEIIKAEIGIKSGSSKSSSHLPDRKFVSSEKRSTVVERKVNNLRQRSQPIETNEQVSKSHKQEGTKVKASPQRGEHAKQHDANVLESDGVPLTEDDVEQLAQDVNNITDDEYIRQIINFLSKSQPELVKGDEVDTEISNLNPKTLIGLRRLVNDIMKQM